MVSDGFIRVQMRWLRLTDLLSGPATAFICGIKSSNLYPPPLVTASSLSSALSSFCHESSVSLTARA